MFGYEIKDIFGLTADDDHPVVLLAHIDGTYTEVTFAPTGIGMWYKDAIYAEIDFPELEKDYSGEFGEEE